MTISSIIQYLCSFIDQDLYDQDILKYGLEVLLYNLLTIIILLLCSFILKNMRFALLFIPIFALLRITIGGFHCKSVYGCSSLMIIIYFTVNYLHNNLTFHSLLTVMSPILILLLLFIKPCNENTLKLKNYNVCYKYGLIIIFFIFYFIFKQTNYFSPIFLALLTTEVMYLMNIIKKSWF